MLARNCIELSEILYTFFLQKTGYYTCKFGSLFKNKHSL